MAKIRDERSLSDEYAAQIGRVSDAWAQLEFRVDLGIWELMQTEHQIAACVTSQFLSIHPRLKAFIALVTVLGGAKATIDKLNSFSGSISGLVEKRNRSVHDPRYRDANSDQMFRLQITARPKVHFGFVAEQKAELERLVAEISSRIDEFTKLRDEAIHEIASLPQESRPTLYRILPVNPAQPDRTSGGG